MIHVSEEFEVALHLLNSKDPLSARELHEKILNEKASRWVNGTDHNGTPLGHIALRVDAGYRKLCILVACQPHLFQQIHNFRCPLHLALENLGKGEVSAPLTKLIDLFPLSLQMPDLDRRLPLHILLEAMPSHIKKFADITNHMQKLVDVAKHMLRIFPEAAAVRHVGRTALILCIKNELPSSLSLAVLHADRSAAGVHDEDGKLPLQNALEVGSDHKLVSAIIKAHPAALHRRMTWLGHHCLPLEYAICRKASPTILDALMCRESMGRVGPWIAAYARATVTGMHYRHRPDSQEVLTLEPGEPPSPGSPLAAFAKRKSTRPEESTYICLFIICVLSMRIYSFELLAYHTIRDLKTSLASCIETPLEMLRLTKDTEDGQVLVDSHTLITAGLESGSQIFLHERHTLLHSAIKAKVDKDFLLEILRLKPGAAREEDSHNERPFTIALKHQCDTPILLELLKLAPGSVRDTIMGTTGVEYTLHYALRSKADVSILSALIESTSLDDWSAAGQYIPKRSRRLSVGSLREEMGMRDTMCLPLHIALQSGSVEAIYRLLDHGCPVESRCPQTGQNALECAILNNHTETMVMYLLRLLVDARETEKEELLRETGSGGQLLIHVAMNGNVTPSLVQQLCTIAPDTLEAQDYRGRLPLHMAATKGATSSVVRKLLDLFPGAAMQMDYHGYTPLLLAIKHHAPPGVVAELITTDPRVLDARSSRGETPLELAACSDAPPWIVDELLHGCVHFIESISLLNGKWPKTKATMDIIRKVREIRERKGIESNAPPRNLTLLPPSRLWTPAEFTKRSLHSTQVFSSRTASPGHDDINDAERDTSEDGFVDHGEMQHSPHICVDCAAPDQENSSGPLSVQFSPILRVSGDALENFSGDSDNVTCTQGENQGGAAWDLVGSPRQGLDQVSTIQDMERYTFEDLSLDDVNVPDDPGDTLTSATWELDDVPCEPSVHASTIRSPGFHSSVASANGALAINPISNRYIYL